jgi:hypothetical protein
MKRVALAGTARSDGECSNLRFVLRIVGVEDVLQGTHSWRILDTGVSPVVVLHASPCCHHWTDLKSNVCSQSVP